MFKVKKALEHICRFRMLKDKFRKSYKLYIISDAVFAEGTFIQFSLSGHRRILHFSYAVVDAMGIFAT